MAITEDIMEVITGAIIHIIPAIRVMVTTINLQLSEEGRDTAHSLPAIQPQPLQENLSLQHQHLQMGPEGRLLLHLQQMREEQLMRFPGRVIQIITGLSRRTRLEGRELPQHPRVQLIARHIIRLTELIHRAIPIRG